MTTSSVPSSPAQVTQQTKIGLDPHIQYIINMASTTPSSSYDNSHVKNIYNAMHGGEMMKKKLKGNKEEFKDGEWAQQDELDRWKLNLCGEIMSGNVESVEEILDSAAKGIEGLNTPIPECRRTILSVAVGHRLKMNLIEKLIDLINNNELAEADSDERTALHEAIRVRNYPAVDLLVKKKEELVTIRDSDGNLPIQLAAKEQQKELTYKLHMVTQQKLIYYLDTETGFLLSALSADLYDFVLYILKGDPDLEQETIMPLLKYLVNESRAFLSRTPFNLFQSWAYSCITVSTKEIMESFKRKEMMKNQPLNSDHSPRYVRRVLRVLLQVLHLPKTIWEKLVIRDIRQAKIRHHLAAEILKNVCWRMSYLWADDPSSLKPLFLLAAENGIHEIIETVLSAYPPAISSRNENGHSVLDIAATYRHDKVFNTALPKTPHDILNAVDNEGEVLLFRVAHQPLQSRLDPGSGVVFQMQRELRWYKELENIVPEQRKHRNKQGKTPMVVFNEKHQDLVEYENKWMLQMANSCIVGGSLIVTIVFAAAITVPGGNKEDTGLPFFLSDVPYQVFAFSNAISLILALTSVLIFISIFTSRYSINDYLYSLPARMILGLVFLFLSVTSLMMDFTVILYIVSGERHRMNAFIIAALACIPVGFFAYLQLPSLVNMIRSTYGRHIFQVKERHDDGDEDVELLNYPV